MRKIRIIEHISLDGVIQAPGGPNEDGDYPHGGWGRCRITTRPWEKPSSRGTARLSISCWAAEPLLRRRGGVSRHQ
jgi:hypothetical protein